MTIEFHPPNTLLGAYAAGTLDLGQHIAVATHLTSCRFCRAFVERMEHVGGALLERSPPETLSASAFAATEARLDESAPPPRAARGAKIDPAVPGLPAFVGRYRFGRWTFVSPGVRLRRVELPHPSPTRVFLLSAGPGTTLLEHTHTGVEMTCVLQGSFRHGGHRYGPGDFDFGDDTIEHQPLVEAGPPCLCLVAMTGKLRLKGLFGRLMQPFVNL